MREDWTQIRLGDISKISSGKAIPSIEIEDEYRNGLYPCYGGNGLRGYTKEYLYDGTYPIIGRVGALCGNVHLANGKFYPTEHALVMSLNGKELPHFIEYLLLSLNLNQYAKGVAQPVLSASTLSDLKVSLPPLSEQERIVAELDLLSGIIDKQKAQLKDLDNLAQSIFYDMFGDPVKNEKGWDVKKLGTVLKTTSGGTPSKGHPEYYENGEIPWVNSGDLHQTFISNTPKHITQAGVDHSSAKLFPVDTCLIAMYGATVGEVSILKIQSTTNQAVCGIFPSKDYLPIFLYSALKYSKDHFVSLASGGAQPNISQGIIKDFDLITPSISLQQSFAEKMEILESQKVSINNSIAESNKLFDYTMAKYFG